MEGEGPDRGTVEDLKISNIQNKFKISGNIFASKKYFLIEKHTCRFSNRKCIPAHSHITHSHNFLKSGLHDPG